MQNEVKADVNLLWRKFCELHNARPPITWRGKYSLHESEELGYLAARGLDDLDLPVPEKYTGRDLYQREIFRSLGEIDFGTFKVAGSPRSYSLLNEILKRHLREMVRNPAYLAELREATREDVDTRLWVRLVFSEIARLATTLSASR